MILKKNEKITRSKDAVTGAHDFCDLNVKYPFHSRALCFIVIKHGILGSYIYSVNRVLCWLKAYLLMLNIPSIFILQFQNLSAYVYWKCTLLFMVISKKYVESFNISCLFLLCKCHMTQIRHILEGSWSKKSVNNQLMIMCHDSDMYVTFCFLFQFQIFLNKNFVKHWEVLIVTH